MSEFLDTPELQDKVIVRLVDDDKDFLRSMKLMLEMMGWKVRDFSLAQDFLQEENFKVPGCIVLDMRMHRARYADAWDDRFRTSKATY